MTVKFLETLDGELAETGWHLYTTCFRPLQSLAANRHLMYRNEFDEVMADPRVDKVLTLDDGGELAGLATFTRHLEAVPLIAPEFYEACWPQPYLDKKIWYIGFVAVAPNRRGGAAFLDSFGEFYRIAAAEAGLVAMDICTYNELRHHLPQTIERQVSRLSGGASKAVRADSQHFWVFDMQGVHL
jgi:hypothetical protein